MAFGMFCAFGAMKAYRECRYGNNAVGLTPWFYVIGAFVWGDVLVFGIFWTLVSMTVFFLQDWILFLLIFSVFWLVRSLGETIYWFNQQFSKIVWHPAKKLPGYNLVKNDYAIWFVYQIVMQCILVVSIIATIYLSSRWLSSLGR